MFEAEEIRVMLISRKTNKILNLVLLSRAFKNFIFTLGNFLKGNLKGLHTKLSVVIWRRKGTAYLLGFFIFDCLLYYEGD